MWRDVPVSQTSGVWLVRRNREELSATASTREIGENLSSRKIFQNFYK